jgi:hypothetical protein
MAMGTVARGTEHRPWPGPRANEGTGGRGRFRANESHASASELIEISGLGGNVLISYPRIQELAYFATSKNRVTWVTFRTGVWLLR